MSIVIGVIVAIASLAVVAAYMFGRAEGIRVQKATTLGIISKNTRHWDTFDCDIRNDTATVREIQDQAESRTDVFKVLLNISDEELC